MANKEKGLTPKQRHALELLIAGTGKTYKEICEEVGVNNKTLYRWRHEPEFAHFQEEYAKLKEEQWLTTVETARAAALKLCADGNEKMVEFILKNDGLNPTNKIDADVKGEQNIIITIGEDDDNE